MELRKRKNIQYNTKNEIPPEEMIGEEIENSNLLNNKSLTTKSSKNNSKRKRNVNIDSEFEYTSANESKSTTGSSTSNKKKKNKKKYEIYNIVSDTEDTISRYDPIIQQNVTITTPLRTMKKIKFNNAINEVVDLVGDSDEDIETITILDSDDNEGIYTIKLFIVYILYIYRYLYYKH